MTVFEDASGNPLDVGRKQRTVSTSLRRALYARDRCCTFPGCHRKRHLDGHHLEHWIHGGETSLENTTLLCTYHHRRLHEGGFIGTPAQLVEHIGGHIERGVGSFVFFTSDRAGEPTLRLFAEQVAPHFT